MEQYFDIRLTDDQLRAISSVGLAHMGDAVFEILVRGWLCAHGKATGKGLHQATIRLVCAESQAQKAQRILPPFDGGGAGRFSSGDAMPRCTPCRLTPAVPNMPRPPLWMALLGWLYLRGKKSGHELFCTMMEE